MISLFEPCEPAAGDVVPLEFVTLDEPEAKPLEALRTEIEAVWSGRVAEMEQRLASAQSNLQMAVDAVRHESEDERRQIADEAEENIADARREVAAILVGFAGERRRYFAEVEREVVRLALAIAERVLHREAAMDPMLLRSAVRVALERVEGEEQATLHVAAGSGAAWRGVLDRELKEGAVALVEDEQIENGGAVLQTSVGRVDLGVREQLKEIERGFFDLLEKRPG